MRSYSRRRWSKDEWSDCGSLRLVAEGDSGLCGRHVEGSGEFAGEILWNFTKFLINREGEVVARLEPRVRPEMQWVYLIIEEELKEGQEEPQAED